MGINDKSSVEAQYKNAGNLSTRISIHDKYSTNKQGFGNWITSQYRIEEGMKVLELGCGTGSMWTGKGDLIAKCSKLILSDFSQGMLEKAKETLKEYEGIEYRVIDIQDIPFADGTFDIVVANMMLYHVPDLQKSLREVQRVLKNDGIFYCATYGENGIMEYVGSLFAETKKDNPNYSFTLQNGGEKLLKVFRQVTRLDYIDSLAVTDPEDLTDYVYSLTGMSSLKEIPRETMVSVFRANMKDGVLHVPKEYGMFVASGQQMMKENGMKEFYLNSDGIKLHAKLDKPEVTDRCPLCILIHGFTGHMEEEHIIAAQKAMNDAGVAVLRVEMYGHGQSEGEFLKHTLYKWVSNAMDIIKYAKTLDFVTDLYLSGHSQGGLLTMLVGGMYADDFKAILPLSPAWNIPEGARQGDMLGLKFDSQHIPGQIGYDQWILSGDYLRVAQTIHVEDEIARYDRPVIIIHGDEDDIVPYVWAEKAYALYKNAKLIPIHGDDHCFTRHLDQMAAAVRTFFENEKQGSN